MPALRIANLALKFLLELAAFAAFASWGTTVGHGALSVLLAIVVPAVAIVLWGVFAVPNGDGRADTLARMVARWRSVGISVVLSAIAVAAPASAASHPKTGHYAGTSTTNAVGNGPQPFSMTISHGKCASAGAKLRHKAYCVTVDVQGGPQTTCSDGTIAEEFFPVYEPIALSAKRRISHNYTLYAGAGGQISDTHVAGTSKVGTFEFSLKVSTSGTATGTMNYSVAGCDSGPLKISVRHKN